MATVQIQWQASDRLLLAEIAQTGKAQPADRTLTIDLTQVPAEQRTGLLTLTKPTGATHNGEPTLNSIDISRRLAPDTTADRLAERGTYDTVMVRLDAAPTIEQIIALAQEIAAQRTGLDAAAEQIRAQRRTEAKRLDGIAAAAQADLDAIAQTGDLDALRAWRVPAELGDTFSEHRARRLREARDRAIAHLEELSRESEKAYWILDHGSEHLKRCIEAGYDCKRQYVVERAAMEAPGFTVDFDDKAAWDRRACPTAAALDAEDAARALGLGEPQIVWLKTPAQDRPPAHRSEWEEDDFAACEAVVVRGYLGKYDLVQIVAGSAAD